MTLPEYLLGLDLGKRRDWTALAVVRARPVPSGRTETVPVGFSLERGTVYGVQPILHNRYELVHLDRWRERTYPACAPEIRRVIDRLRTVSANEILHRDRMLPPGDVMRHTLLVDGTGVGVAVVDQLRGAGLDVTGITIHGGTSVNRDDKDLRVPKRALVGAMEVVVESRRLQTPPEEQMPLVTTLLDEMDQFTASTKLETGHDSYGVANEWLEGAHDDLVLAVAMAVWYGEHRRSIVPKITAPTGALLDYLNAQ